MALPVILFRNSLKVSPSLGIFLYTSLFPEHVKIRDKKNRAKQKGCILVNTQVQIEEPYGNVFFVSTYYGSACTDKEQINIELMLFNEAFLVLYSSWISI